MKKTFAAVLLVWVSVNYLDIPLAEFILHTLGRIFLFSRSVSGLPDLLFSTVVACSAFAWGAHFHFRRRGDAVQALRYLVPGLALPAAYAAKTVLKWGFGRTDSRAWLENPQIGDAFHWFAGGGLFEGFPSGHMMVFTPLFLAIVRIRPGWRRGALVAWSALAIALVVTGYHFLGDVLAGAFGGYALDAAATRLAGKLKIT